MTIQPHAKDCVDCRSCSPCDEHEKYRRIPRALVVLGGHHCALTLAELRESRSRIDDAIASLSPVADEEPRSDEAGLRARIRRLESALRDVTRAAAMGVCVLEEGRDMANGSLEVTRG